MDFLVRFEPARPCSDHHCIAMTNVGLANCERSNSFVVEPYCPKHCYFVALKPSQQQEKWNSIANFVLSEMGGQGKVLEIKQVSYDEAKKHNIETCKNDDIWRVKYHPGKGHNIICHVVWLDMESEFVLYKKGR